MGRRSANDNILIKTRENRKEGKQDNFFYVNFHLNDDLGVDQIVCNSMRCMVERLLTVLTVTVLTLAVQKSTQNRTIRVFIPAILLNVSLGHCDSTFLFRELILKSLDLRHVNDDYNINQLTN